MVKWMMQKTFNLAVQAGNLRKHFPDGTTDIRKSELTWVGTLKPSPLSTTYTVRIRYKLRKRPNVEVLDPKLEKRDGEKPPHMFSGERLCLYLGNEWDSSMLLADTIVPWAAEWLLHYEIWLATGEWCGGGVHPDINPKWDEDPPSEAVSKFNDKLSRKKPR